MKTLDALLLSVAIGLSLFTVYLFASDYPAAPPAGAPQRRRAVQAIIVHGVTARHERVGGELPFHVFVDRAGPIYGPFWTSGAPTPHTGHREADERSLAVAVSAGADRARVVQLLASLCREYALPVERVLSHEEMDPRVGCPGPGLDMSALRADVSRAMAPDS